MKSPADMNIGSPAGKSLLVFGALIIAWCAAWFIKVALDQRFIFVSAEAGSAVYWLTAKVLLWIIPACWLVWNSKRRFVDVFNFADWRRWVLWGGLVGIAIALTGIIPKWWNGVSVFPSRFDYGTLNVLVIAPLFEEFLMRGALLGSLIPAFGFARANLITAACFVVLHIPGWFMMGSLEAKLSQPIGGAVSVFLLGLLFGWVTRRGGSFLGASLAHCLNNLAA
jgi:membrane protease YdiL (CAAX protease family)